MSNIFLHPIYVHHFTQEHDRHHHPMHHNSHKSGRSSTQIDHHKKFKSKIIHSTQFALHRLLQVLYKTSTSIYQK